MSTTENINEQAGSQEDRRSTLYNRSTGQFASAARGMK